MRCVISDGALKGGMHEITQSRMWSVVDECIHMGLEWG